MSASLVWGKYFKKEEPIVTGHSSSCLHADGQTVILALLSSSIHLLEWNNCLWLFVFFSQTSFCSFRKMNQLTVFGFLCFFSKLFSLYSEIISWSVCVSTTKKKIFLCVRYQKHFSEANFWSLYFLFSLIIWRENIYAYSFRLNQSVNDVRIIVNDWIYCNYCNLLSRHQSASLDNSNPVIFFIANLVGFFLVNWHSFL